MTSANGSRYRFETLRRSLGSRARKSCVAFKHWVKLFVAVEGGGGAAAAAATTVVAAAGGGFACAVRF